jgi:hypothetical protein
MASSVPLSAVSDLAPRLFDALLDRDAVAKAPPQLVGRSGGSKAMSQTRSYSAKGEGGGEPRPTSESTTAAVSIGED